MGSFQGGSAYAMVREIAGGFLLVTDRTFAALSPAQLDTLTFEMDRLLREVRGTQVPVDELKEVQQRQRRLSRLTTALQMLRSHRQRRRR